uniref:Variant surface glycoprotein n=1 Tax=Trypanosoma brucei TaxID=5691 RepID=A0A1V0FY26_9TRYP|nr:variant surface glycoprotein [Trypanosoma brucei]
MRASVTGAFLAALITASAAQADLAAKAAKVKEPCQELLFLTKALAALTGKAAEARRVAQKLRQEQAIYSLGSCYGKTDRQRTAYSVLQSLAAKRAAQAEADAAAGELQEAEHTRTIVARMAQLRLLHHNTVGKATFPEGATLTQNVEHIFSAGASTCTVAYANTPIEDLKCLSTVSDAADIAAAGEGIYQLKSMKTIQTSDFSSTKLKIKLAALGTVSGTGATTTENNGCVTNTGATGALSSKSHGFAIADVKKQGDYTATATDIDATKGAGQGCLKPAAGEAAEKAVADAGSLARAICELKTLKETDQKETATTTVSSLAADGEAQALAELLLTGEIKASTSSEEKKKMVNQIFGSSEQTVEQEFIQPLRSEKPDYKDSGAPNTKDLVTLAGSNDYTKALAFCVGKQHRELANQKSAVKAPAPTLEDCKGSKEDDCDKEKCDFKDGKCKAKVTEATGTDSKTNTTTSNSFVINKTPLLLAALLF